MIEVDINDTQIQRAESLYTFNSLTGSITRGQSQIYGAIGEILVHDYFVARGATVDFNSTYDYDLVINGAKVDVKTKRTTVKPMHDYLCSISSYNIRQKCDYYFFVRVKEGLSKGYLLGYKEKSMFFANAAYQKRGDTDTNGWKFKDDCYNIPVSGLNKFKTDVIYNYNNGVKS